MRVFLCHASQDKSVVRQLYQRLIEDGFDVWFDEEKLLPGQDWNREIIQAVRNADTVIICLSTSSITKTGYVQKEIRLTLDAADERPDGAIFLIPARLEECYVPERLARFQWVDLYKTDGYARLIKSLDFAESKQVETNNIASDNRAKIETGISKPISFSKQQSETSSGKVKLLTLVLRSTGVSQRDRERINGIYDTLISYHGKDRFSFQILEKDGSSYVVDFANATTLICVDLLIQLHNVLYAAAPFNIQEISPQNYAVE